MVLDSVQLTQHVSLPGGERVCKMAWSEQSGMMAMACEASKGTVPVLILDPLCPQEHVQVDVPLQAGASDNLLALEWSPPGTAWALLSATRSGQGQVWSLMKPESENPHALVVDEWYPQSVSHLSQPALSAFGLCMYGACKYAGRRQQTAPFSVNQTRPAGPKESTKTHSFESIQSHDVRSGAVLPWQCPRPSLFPISQPGGRPAQAFSVGEALLMAKWLEAPGALVWPPSGQLGQPSCPGLEAPFWPAKPPPGGTCLSAASHRLRPHQLCVATITPSGRLQTHWLRPALAALRNSKEWKCSAPVQVAPLEVGAVLAADVVPDRQSSLVCAWVGTSSPSSVRLTRVAGGSLIPGPGDPAAVSVEPLHNVMLPNCGMAAAVRQLLLPQADSGAAVVAMAEELSGTSGSVGVFRYQELAGRGQMELVGMHWETVPSPVKEEGRAAPAALHAVKKEEPLELALGSRGGSGMDIAWPDLDRQSSLDLRCGPGLVDLLTEPSTTLTPADLAQDPGNSLGNASAPPARHNPRAAAPDGPEPLARLVACPDGAGLLLLLGRESRRMLMLCPRQMMPLEALDAAEMAAGADAHFGATAVSSNGSVLAATLHLALRNHHRPQPHNQSWLVTWGLSYKAMTCAGGTSADGPGAFKPVPPGGHSQPVPPEHSARILADRIAWALILNRPVRDLAHLVRHLFLHRTREAVLEVLARALSILDAAVHLHDHWQRPAIGNRLDRIKIALLAPMAEHPEVLPVLSDLALRSRVGSAMLLLMPFMYLLCNRQPSSAPAAAAGGGATPMPMAAMSQADIDVLEGWCSWWLNVLLLHIQCYRTWARESAAGNKAVADLIPCLRLLADHNLYSSSRGFWILSKLVLHTLERVMALDEQGKEAVGKPAAQQQALTAAPAAETQAGEDSAAAPEKIPARLEQLPASLLKKLKLLQASCVAEAAAGAAAGKPSISALLLPLLQMPRAFCQKEVKLEDVSRNLTAAIQAQQSFQGSRFHLHYSRLVQPKMEWSQYIRDWANSSGRNLEVRSSSGEARYRWCAHLLDRFEPCTVEDLRANAVFLGLLPELGAVGGDSGVGQSPTVQLLHATFKLPQPPLAEVQPPGPIHNQQADPARGPGFKRGPTDTADNTTAAATAAASAQLERRQRWRRARDAALLGGPSRDADPKQGDGTRDGTGGRRLTAAGIVAYDAVTGHNLTEWEYESMDGFSITDQIQDHLLADADVRCKVNILRRGVLHCAPLTGSPWKRVRRHAISETAGTVKK